MTNSYATESENGCVTSCYPRPDAPIPHVALAQSHLVGAEGKPVLVVSRLSPNDARALAASLSQCADRVKLAYEEYEAEALEADDGA